MNNKITTLIFFLVTTSLQAQEIDRKLYFGYSFGINQSHILDNYDAPIIIKNALGFRLGGFATYKIKPRFNLTARSELSYNNGVIYRVNQGPYTEYQKILPHSNEFMLHIEVYDKKNQFYTLAGPNYKLAVPNKSAYSNQLISNSDLAFDVGVGIKIPIGNFTLSPQVRYSFGLYGISASPALPYSTFNNAAFVLSFR